jgi:type II secretory pathway pseudopilin PulG
MNKHYAKSSVGEARPGGSPMAAPRRQLGFTLAETLVGVGVFGVLFCALFAGLSWSFTTVENARERLRATQIMAEKMDTIRLYTWDQLTNRGYIPTNFTMAFYPTNGLNAGTSRSAGIIYSGTITISNAPVTTEDYANTLRTVVIDLSWQRGLLTLHTQMSTLVSQYGIETHTMF